ncbi:hypothetical protein A0J57_17365 [Sphingobium sp. 22B]|uniref:DUF2141 domain-containing protein n=1 Tax=unclassified Sphingobium TaxID=2611147 RepID=UPI00065C6D00|nr:MULTISPECIES: DUF2141 domain-containing protein [unclassified Sphingobium]KXU31749.1 hypothetical protein AXW74_10860 [Sphingobium sp. AM]KYC31049.1 hypothetical protein A0J57_17365 [Sphingobium sp. 22B]OAP30949.1 hypothetical protein A8O16_15730 [Sphingobium sp. 20006FA]
MIATLLLAAAIPSTPDLGKAEGQCRVDEKGPAFLVDVNGLKDRKGRLKLELYPADDADFLADDNLLVAAGKPFRRVEVAVPATGPVQLCIRAPGPGTYALSLLHDRDANRRFSLSVDGIGFPGNPKLGWSRPSAAAARAVVGSGPAHIGIIVNYRRGLLSFGPVEK